MDVIFTSKLPLRASVVLLAIACGTTACTKSTNRTSVVGTVTLDGSPLQEGRISFTPTDGNTGPQAGSVIVNGVYEIPADIGVTVGKNLVEIRGNKKTGRKIPSVYGDPPVDERIEAIPARYNSNSELIRELVAGEINKFDFDLVTK